MHQYTQYTYMCMAKQHEENEEDAARKRGTERKRERKRLFIRCRDETNVGASRVSCTMAIHIHWQTGEK